MTNRFLRVTSKHKCQCLYTPGHTLGSCCYYFAEEGWLFSGDTLFAGSVGRSDFPTGDAQALLKSLNHVVMRLPDEVIVYRDMAHLLQSEKREKQIHL